ncbi:MAG: hypothetical protein GTN81_10420 [Proteobacteria bacterium]|nr:hypothetical protein [Pseudomonadota bacterium]
MMTERYRPVGALLIAFAVMGLTVSSTVRADSTYNMVNDYRLYTYSEYQAKRQHKDLLQINVLDDRGPQVEEEPTGKPTLVTTDALWMEPVPQMLERLLMRELAVSFLFRKVVRKDLRSGLVLELKLRSFHGRTERVGLLGRLIYGDVAFSAKLHQQKPRKILFTKDYHSRTRVKVKSIGKSRRRAMVEQIGNSLEEIIPALISDMEQVLQEKRPPKKLRKVKRKAQKAIDLEPVGPK